MKNKLQAIGILFVILIALIAIASIVTKKDDLEVIEETIENKTYEVTSFPQSEISSISFTNEGETDSYTRTENGWTLNGSTLPISQTALAYSCGIISNFSANEKFDSSSNQYGTDTSTKSVIATLNDDSYVSFTFGTNTPDGVYSYVKIEGSDNDGIYSMPVMITDSFVLTKDKSAFKNFEQIEFETLNKIVINQKDYQNLVLEVPTEERKIDENLQGISTMLMVSPYKDKTIFMQNFVDDIFPTITALSFGELVESDCQDLSKYGLDNPFLTIEIISNNGELKLQVGDEADDLHYYVKNKDENHVFLMTKELLEPFVNVDCYSFLNKFTMLNGVDSVESLNIVIGSDNYELTKNTVNGKVIDETQYSNLYKSIIGVQLSLYTDEQLNGDSVEQSYDFTLNDGTTKNYKYYSYNDQYDAFYDSDAQMWALVSKAELDNISNNLKSITQ